MGRSIKGTLIKRGKAGNFYLKYSVNGKLFKQALKDENENPITNEKKALKARDIILAPYWAKDEVKRQEMVVAALHIAEEKAAIADAIIDGIDNPPLTFAGAWQAYVDAQNRPRSGERTLKNYQGHFVAFNEWLNAQKPKPVYLKDITPEHATKFAVSLNKSGKSANTFNKYTSFLRLFFKVLAKPGQISSNPFHEDTITRRDLSTNSRRELSIDELKKILSEATGDMALLLGLGTFTGLRLGDCCTLQWKEVDLINRIIKRVPNKTVKKRKSVIIGIPGPLYNCLVEIPIKSRGDYVLPEYARIYLGSSHGKAYISKRIQSFFEKTGIQTQQKGTGKTIDPETKEVKDTGKRAVVEVGFHSLRHTYISIHANAGTPQAIIRDNAGHSNQRMTSEYTHISMEAARRVAGALEAPFMDVIPVEPERGQLAELSQTLPIEKIREFLKSLENK